jgi:hypothetical protein
MKISIVLYKGKLLSTGEYPIAINLFHKGKRKLDTTMKVSCKESNWNKKQKQVRSQDKAYKEKNAIIKEKLEYIEKRAKEYFTMFNDYDFDFIVSDKPIIQNLNTDTEIEPEITNFFDIIDRKIEDLARYGSKKVILQVKKCLKQYYGDNIPINSINQKWFNDYTSKLMEKNKPQAKKMIVRFLTCYNWGLDNGYITAYKKLKYNKKDFEYQVEKRALNKTEFSFLKEMRNIEYSLYKEIYVELNMCTIYDYTYNFSNIINALSIAMCIYYLQGLARSDLSKLKVGDLEVKVFRGEELDVSGWSDCIDDPSKKDEMLKKLKKTLENKPRKYYSIKTNVRTKTGRPIKIVQFCDIINPYLQDYFYREDGTKKDKNDYLFNIFENGKVYTDKQRTIRINNCFSKMSKAIKDCLKTNNQDFHFDFYSIRHTYLTNGNKAGVAHNILAKNAGHNEVELDTYLADFDDETYLKANETIANY